MEAGEDEAEVRLKQEADMDARKRTDGGATRSTIQDEL